MSTATSITVRVPLAIRHRGRRNVGRRHRSRRDACAHAGRSGPGESLAPAPTGGSGCRRAAASVHRELAANERIDRSYLGRTLRLTLLAPDIVEAILGGWADQRVVLEKLERPLLVGWEEQRRHLKPAAQ